MSETTPYRLIERVIESVDGAAKAIQSNPEAMIAEWHALRDALLRYGQHVSGCRQFFTGDCDCGWPEVKAALMAPGVP